jgi:hypothetical protein
MMTEKAGGKGADINPLVHSSSLVQEFEDAERWLLP